MPNTILNPRRAMTLKHMINAKFTRKAVASLFAAVALALPAGARAQYYEIANQLPSLIRPALSGSSAYRGSLEAAYSKTVGSYDADFLEFSTSQGFLYAGRFFWGVGIGADILFAHPADNWGQQTSSPAFDTGRSRTTTAVMLPLFTDFRLSLGSPGSANFFLGLRVGCSFLLSDDYIKIGNGVLTNREYFYLRPSLGIRIPADRSNPKKAIAIALNYKLLTGNYWVDRRHNIALNGFGVSAAFEW